MRQTYLKISFIFFIIFCFFSCSENKYQVDLEGIESQIELKRLESEFETLDDEDFENQILQLQSAEPLIVEVLIEQVFSSGRSTNPNYKVLKKILLDSSFKEILVDVGKKHADLSSIETQLTQAFKHVKYYFPNDTVPTTAYTLVSGLNGPGFTYEGILGISLDWYMGKGYAYYNTQVFPKYLQRRMQEQYIVPQVVEGYFRNEFPIEKYTDGTLLSEMIYWGKQLEYTKMMMPELNDTLIIEYTAKNLKWCFENEGMIYKHFVDGNLWFETDQNQIFRYVSDGPYTIAPNVPIESAPRLGWFVGWQIVRHYFDNEGYGDASQLFENTDYQDIFKKAKYKP